MAKIDLGRLTQDEMPALLRELMDLMPEADVLTVLRDWIKDNKLEGELD